MTAIDTPSNFRDTAPEPGAPRPYHFPHVTRSVAANGLRVLVAETHNAPLVSLRALIRSGAEHDPQSLAGIASFTADLLDEGAGTRDAVGLAEAVGILGGALGTGADWDASYVSFDVLSRNIREALAIFGDVAMRPTFPGDGLERVRKERLTEIVQQRDEPGAIAGKRFAGLLYGNGPYGNPIIGTSETVAAIGDADVRDFFGRHYVPNNSSIVVTGDVDADTAVRLVDETFATWKTGSEVARREVSPRAVDGTRVYLIDRPQAVQSEIRVGHVGVPRSCEDYFALSVMNALLGGVFNSRINLNLRERHGYTYGARSSFAFRRQAGPFVVSAPVRNEVTRESIVEMLGELRRIRTGDVDARELSDVKSYLMGVFPATVQSASDIAGRLLDMELYGLSEDYFDRYRENIAAVSKEEVERVAQKYIDPDRTTVVVVGNAAQIRESLGTLGVPLHELDMEGQPVA
jgi:zinc protease